MLAKRTLFRYSYSLLRLVRAGNLGIIAVSQYAVAVLLVFQHENVWEVLTDAGLFCLVLATVLVAAAGYIINDYYDVKIDVINRPNRVVIDRVLRRREALGLHFVLNLVGFGFSLLAGKLVTLLVLCAALFLWVYSNSLKRLPLSGNLVIALLTALTVLLPAIYFRQQVLLTLVYATFAGLITIIREILKDMEDVRGDERHGCRTLPIVYGLARTKTIIYFVIGVFSLLLVPLSLQVSVAAAIGAGGFILALAALAVAIARADTRHTYGKLASWCKALMLVGIASMLLA